MLYPLFAAYSQVRADFYFYIVCLSNLRPCEANRVEVGHLLLPGLKRRHSNES